MSRRGAGQAGRCAWVYEPPASVFVERVGFKRCYSYDAWRLIVTRALIVVGLIATVLTVRGAAWWVYVVLAVAALDSVAELAVWRDLGSFGKLGNRVTHLVAATNVRSWRRGVGVNATGVGGFISGIGLGFFVLPFGLPTDVTVAQLCIAWTLVVLFMTWCGRAGVYATTDGRRFASALEHAWYLALRWGVWPILALASVSLAIVCLNMQRMVVIGAAFPALLVASIIPLLFRAETGLADRILMAADEVHDEDLADLRSRVVARAVSIAAPLAATAEGALRTSTAGASEDAALAVANTADLIGTLRDSDDDVVSRSAMGRALTASARWWGGPVGIQCEVDDLNIAEAETCMRLTRRLARALAMSFGDPEGELGISLRPAGTRDRALLLFELPTDLRQADREAIKGQMAEACAKIGVTFEVLSPAVANVEDSPGATSPTVYRFLVTIALARRGRL